MVLEAVPAAVQSHFMGVDHFSHSVEQVVCAAGAEAPVAARKAVGECSEQTVEQEEKGALRLLFSVGGERKANYGEAAYDGCARFSSISAPPRATERSGSRDETRRAQQGQIGRAHV